MNVQTIKDKIETCQKCPLRNKLAIDETPYCGVGSNKPSVFIIIRPPTKEYQDLIDGLDLLYLESNLKKYNIPKTELYITSFIKCRTKICTKTATTTCVENNLKLELNYFKPYAVFIVGSSNNIKYLSIDEIYQGSIYICPHSFYELATNSKLESHGTQLFNAIRKQIELSKI